MRILASEGIRAFIVEMLTSLSLAQKSFPYRNPYECIFRNPFLMGVFLIIIGRGAQETSLYIYMETMLGLRQNRQPSSPFIMVASASNPHQKLISSTLQKSRQLCRPLVRQVLTGTRPTGLFGASLYTLPCVVPILQNYPYHLL